MIKIVHSTLVAETIAKIEGVQSAVYTSVLLKWLYSEITNIPMEICTDKKSLHDALWSHKHVSDKRFRIDIGALKDMLQTQETDQICWVNSFS